MKSAHLAWCLISSLALSLSLGGCASSPIAEVGVTAHDGNKVDPGFEVLGLKFGGNQISTRAARYRDGQYDAVAVYVAEVHAAGSSDGATGDIERLRSEARRAARQSLSKFGRFRVVESKGEANFTVTPEVRTMVAWGDWHKSLEQLQADYPGAFWMRGTTERARDIAREGIDVFITLEYSDWNGQFFAQSVVGRQAAAWGELLAKAEGAAPSGSLNVKDSKAGTSARIDIERMSQTLQEAFDGAIAVSLFERGSLDQRYWEPKPGVNGVFARKDGAQRPTAAAPMKE
jgi:hypothetical protein